MDTSDLLKQYEDELAAFTKREQNRERIKDRVVYVYALKDPVTQEIKYIGSSANPKQRLASHLSKPLEGKESKLQWIAALKQRDLKPLIEILETTTEADRLRSEDKWYSHYRSLGCELLQSPVKYSAISATFDDLYKQALQYAIDQSTAPVAGRGQPG